MLFPISILISGIVFTPFMFNYFSIGANPDTPMLIYVFSVMGLAIASIYIASNIIFRVWKIKK